MGVMGTVFMDVYGLLGVYECIWVPIGVYGFLGVYGCLWISMGVYRFL